MLFQINSNATSSGISVAFNKEKLRKAYIFSYSLQYTFRFIRNPLCERFFEVCLIVFLNVLLHRYSLALVVVQWPKFDSNFCFFFKFLNSYSI